MWMIFGAAAALAAPNRCSDARTSENPDFEGHCCYDGQVWQGTACIGIPTDCPTGWQVDASHQTCVALPCEEGQTTSRGHCCWPSQAWSSTLNTCKGLPTCPRGYEARGETCARPGEAPAGHGMFATEGDGGSVWLRGESGARYRPGEAVPPGVYDIECDFGQSQVVAAGRAHVRAGVEAVIVCSSVFRLCRVSEP